MGDPTGRQEQRYHCPKNTPARLWLAVARATCSSVTVLRWRRRARKSSSCVRKASRTDRRGRVGTEVVELLRVGLQVEQLLAFAQPVHVAPACVAQAEGAAFVHAFAEQQARVAEAVVELAERDVAPVGAGSRRAAAAAGSGLRCGARGTGMPERVENRRHDVDRFDEARLARAARGVGRAPRVDDDERHARTTSS